MVVLVRCLDIGLLDEYEGFWSSSVLPDDKGRNPCFKKLKIRVKICTSSKIHIKTFIFPFFLHVYVKFAHLS